MHIFFSESTFNLFIIVGLIKIQNVSSLKHSENEKLSKNLCLTEFDYFVNFHIDENFKQIVLSFLSNETSSVISLKLLTKPEDIFIAFNNLENCYQCLIPQRGRAPSVH